MAKPKIEAVKYSKKDFIKALDDVSNKMGYSLNMYPVFFQQDNGAFSIKINVEATKNN